MVEYSKVNVKLSDTQLKKLKTAVKMEMICHMNYYWQQGKKQN